MKQTTRNKKRYFSVPGILSHAILNYLQLASIIYFPLLRSFDASFPEIKF
jgi:hypothetical protein